MLNDAELDDEMRRLARHTVSDCLARYGEPLDYSERSLISFGRIVEASAERLRAATKNDQAPSERQLFALCLTLGAYLGEVIRRARGGAWVRSDSVDGPVPAVAFDGAAIYPTERIRRALVGEAPDLGGLLASIRTQHPAARPRCAQLCSCCAELPA